MISYILRRIAMLVPLLIAVTLAIFILMNVIPGDPTISLMNPKKGQMDPEAAERFREAWGLNDPLHIQYLKFFSNAVRGDLGFSFRFNMPVTRIILERVPATLQLGLAALLIAVILGVPGGILASLRHREWIDTAIMGFCVLGVSMPVFWLGLLLMYLFAVKIPLLPAGGFGSFKFLILPSITLGLTSVAMISRMTRSAMLEVLNEDYIRTARAKGLLERVIIYKHAFKNAMVSILTVIGLQIGYLMAGAVITETVFAWPGVGRLLVDSIGQRDLPVVQGIMMFTVFVFAITNLVVDIAYVCIDPRIHYN